MSDCASVRLDLPALLMNDLENGRREEIESHLRACPACRAEHDDLGEVVGLLEGTLYAAPPAELEADVFTLVELDDLARQLERAPVHAEPPLDLERRVLGRAEPLGARRRAAAFVAPSMAAAAVVLAVAGVNWRSRAEDMEDRVRTMRAQFGSVGQPVQTVEFASLATPAPEAAAEVMAYEPESYRLVLRGHGLPSSPPGHHYEVWLLGPRGRVLCGTFRIGDLEHTVLSFPLGIDPFEYTSIDVLLEPDTDPNDLDGELVLQGRLSPRP